MAKPGARVQVHYIGTFDDGVEFDNSYNRDQPLEFILGAQMMIPGFDRAVQGMKVGDSVEVRLEPEDAYGIYRKDLIRVVPLSHIPHANDLPIGHYIVLGEAQNACQVLVEKIEGDRVTFNLNHPLAGKCLNFTIELISEQTVSGDDQSNKP
ncbi:MAG: peptidylprolyl isomerase [Coriobacteriales bacterium]|jgi:FKBP-type peptidyl-prolyl cis-trans isomerase 2|nr:peptidylprolyl isomerase [Coriobacteriales bacterium]